MRASTVHVRFPAVLVLPVGRRPHVAAGAILCGGARLDGRPTVTTVTSLDVSRDAAAAQRTKP